MKTIGLVGARGYVGRELTTLVERHGGLDLRFAISQRDGKSPADVAAAPEAESTAQDEPESES